jgi:hypothetical protein
MTLQERTFHVQLATRPRYSSTAMPRARESLYQKDKCRTSYIGCTLGQKLQKGPNLKRS